MEELNENPIDWDLALERASNKEELAVKILNMLIESFPEVKKDLNTALNTKDAQQLQEYVHSLHGAASYCGVPRLKAVAMATETSIKKNEIDEALPLVQQLLTEIDLVVQSYEANDYRPRSNTE